LDVFYGEELFRDKWTRPEINNTTELRERYDNYKTLFIALLCQSTAVFAQCILKIDIAFVITKNISEYYDQILIFEAE
jgi:hypothetical protein